MSAVFCVDQRRVLADSCFFFPFRFEESEHAKENYAECCKLFVEVAVPAVIDGFGKGVYENVAKGNMIDRTKCLAGLEVKRKIVEVKVERAVAVESTGEEGEETPTAGDAKNEAPKDGVEEVVAEAVEQEAGL